MVAWDRMGMAEVVDSGYILQVKPAGIHCWTKSRIPEKQSPTKVSDTSTWKDGTDTYRMRGNRLTEHMLAAGSGLISYCASLGKSLTSLI